MKCSKYNVCRRKIYTKKIAIKVKPVPNNESYIRYNITFHISLVVGKILMILPLAGRFHIIL